MKYNISGKMVKLIRKIEGFLLAGILWIGSISLAEAKIDPSESENETGELVYGR